MRIGTVGGAIVVAGGLLLVGGILSLLWFRRVLP